jgi:hypothetical protein
VADDERSDDGEESISRRWIRLGFENVSDGLSTLDDVVRRQRQRSDDVNETKMTAKSAFL